MTVLHVGGKTTLVDDRYIRERRRTPPGRGGEIFLERKKGETGVPGLFLLGRNNVEDFRKLLRSVKLPQ